MAYLHIDNLYKNQDILLFRECYALEKVHGTSAHIAWKDNQIRLFSGGEKHEKFAPLFDQVELMKFFAETFGTERVVVYGEAYGGKCQGMSKTYGKELRFVAFDVKVDKVWLAVPQAKDVVDKMGLEFVDYEQTSTDLEALDAQRDRPSAQAKRNGIDEDRMREGVVLRPLIEVTTNNGNRVIAKHKRAEFRERQSIPNVDPSRREMLEGAGAIAAEWVTAMRLSHVLDKLGNPSEMKDTGRVIKAMVEDVCREAAGEIAESKAARKAIGARAARLYKARVQTTLSVDT